MTANEHYGIFKRNMAEAETRLNTAEWQAYYAIEALKKENEELRSRVAELERGNDENP